MARGSPPDLRGSDRAFSPNNRLNGAPQVPPENRGTARFGTKFRNIAGRKKMGGYGSGRSGGRSTVEDGLTLNLNKLIRERTFCPNQERRGSIAWTNSVTGERTAWISYRAALEEEHGRVRDRPVARAHPLGEAILVPRGAPCRATGKIPFARSLRMSARPAERSSALNVDELPVSPCFGRPPLVSMTKRPKRALLFWVRAVPRVSVVASIRAVRFVPREAGFSGLDCYAGTTSHETLRTLQNGADFGSIKR